MTPDEIRQRILVEKLARLIEAHYATLPPDKREEAERALDSIVSRLKHRQPKRSRHSRVKP